MNRAAAPVVVAALLAAPAAQAAISCATSLTGLAFGNYDPTVSSPTDITSNLRVTCTRSLFDPTSASYTLAMSRGGSTSYAARLLSAGAAQINYNIYSDAARSQIWGDGTSSTALVGGTITFTFLQFSKSATHTAYGRVPATQNASPGSYGDNIVVTMTF